MGSGYALYIAVDLRGTPLCLLCRIGDILMGKELIYETSSPYLRWHSQ